MNAAAANQQRAQAYANLRARAPNLTPGGSYRQLVSAPAALGAEMRTFMEFQPSKFGGKFRDAVCIRGTEWIGPVIVPANAPTGKCLRNDYIQPGEFADSRLAQFGQLYEKFLFTKLRQRYTPAVGSGQVGSILLAYDRDISDPTPPVSSQGVRQYMSWQDTVQGNVWAPHTLEAKLESPETGFYTDSAPGGDDRLAYQGQTYVALVDPCGNVADLNIGNVSLDYELHLFVPQLQPPTGTLWASNNGTVPPLLADALRQYTVPAAGSIRSPVSNLQWTPGLQQAGAIANAIRLAEGLYRLTNRVTVGAAPAGTLTFNSPTIIPLEPLPAPAPQPQVRAIQNVAQASANQPAYWDGLVDVPRGGADVYQNFASVTTTFADSALALEKIGPYLADINAIF